MIATPARGRQQVRAQMRGKGLQDWMRLALSLHGLGQMAVEAPDSTFRICRSYYVSCMSLYEDAIGLAKGTHVGPDFRIGRFWYRRSRWGDGARVRVCHSRRKAGRKRRLHRREESRRQRVSTSGERPSYDNRRGRCSFNLLLR